MASPHCSVSPSFPLRWQKNSIITRKPQASLSPPKPSKLIKRKNYLRLKLLKTLTNPFPSIPPNPQSTPQNPLKPPEFPPQQHPHINSAQDYDQSLTQIAEGENDEQTQLTLQTLQTSPIPEPESVITTRSVTQLVFYFLGLFVVQTIITVWVMKPDNVDEESQKKHENLNGRKKKGFWSSTNGEAIPNSVVYADDSVLEKKIVEIRAMAKEVRELEAKKLGKFSEEVEVEVEGDGIVPKPVVTKVKTNIQQEVGKKLSNFGKKIRSLGEKELVSKVSYLNNSNEVNNEKKLERSDVTVKDDSLVFKKKGKFKNGLSQPRDKPKGFGNSVINGNNETHASQHTDFGSGIDVPNSGLFGNSPERKEDNRFPVDNPPRSVVTEVGENAKGHDESSVKKLGQENGRKLVKERKSSKTGEGVEIEKNKSRSGIIQESSYGLVEPKASTKLKTGKRPVGDKQVVKNSRDNQASVENDLWWLNLPFALGILLCRTSETEQPGGFYSLKADDGSSSHFVAFEDQRDASNFCYILEAFFDELGDISADVVPLSIKELKDEVEENGMEIIVVRKGQLQLYAGQPLSEVEMNLRSLPR